MLRRQGRENNENPSPLVELVPDLSFFSSLYCRTFRTNTDTIYRFVFLCFQVPIVYIMHCHALWSCRELDVTFPEKTNSHICDLGDEIDIIFRVSFFFISFLNLTFVWYIFLLQSSKIATTTG